MSEAYWKKFEHTVTFVEPGKSQVEGVIEALREEGPKSDPYPVVIVRNSKGWKLRVNITQTRLLGELQRLRPAVGDEIRIVYTGDAEKAVGGLSPAKEFDVAVTRKAAAS